MNGADVRTKRLSNERRKLRMEVALSLWERKWEMKSEKWWEVAWAAL